MYLGDWKDDSVVGRASFSPRGPGFDSQHPQLSVPPVPGDSMPSSDLPKHDMHKMHRHTLAKHSYM